MSNLRILHVIGQRPEMTGSGIYLESIIRESKKHGAEMTNKIIDDHLLKEDFIEVWLINYNENIRTEVHEQIEEIETEIKSKKIKPNHVIDSILNKTKKLQEKAGYKSYESWIRLKTPVRLEDMLNK